MCNTVLLEVETKEEDLSKLEKMDTDENEPLTKPFKVEIQGNKENVSLATPFPPNETPRFKESVTIGKSNF